MIFYTSGVMLRVGPEDLQSDDNVEAFAGRYPHHRRIGTFGLGTEIPGMAASGRPFLLQTGAGLLLKRRLTGRI